MTNGKKKYRFTATYWDYERHEDILYNCDIEGDDKVVLASGLCMFHDESYLQDKDKCKEQSIRDGLDAKIRQSIDGKEPLFCMGYHLPDIIIKENFTKPVSFIKCIFQGKADFHSAKFSEKANFGSAAFSGEADFSSVFNSN